MLDLAESNWLSNFFTRMTLAIVLCLGLDSLVNRMNHGSICKSNLSDQDLVLGSVNFPA